MRRLSFQKFLIKSFFLVGLFSAMNSFGFDKNPALEHLRNATLTSEHERLLRLEALLLHDTVFAASELTGLGTLTGSRLELLSRKIRIKKALSHNYSSEVFLLDQWFRKHQGHDTLYRTKTRDLAHYLLAQVALGQDTRAAFNALIALQNKDGSFGESAGKWGSTALTALCAEALLGSAEATALSGNIQRAVSWLMKDFGNQLSQTKDNLLHLLRVGPLLLTSNAYSKEFDVLWDFVGKAQWEDGSIFGDLELTALSLKLFRALSGNLILDSFAFVSESGGSIASATVGASFAGDLGFRPRFRDYEELVVLHLEVKSSAGALLQIMDTSFHPKMVKNVAQSFRVALGQVDSAVAIKVSGYFIHLENGDTLRDNIAERFLRVEDAPDFRFDGDSLRIVPVSPMAGDTASIRIRFKNAGQTVSRPYGVACQLRRNGGIWDTLGVQGFQYAGTNVPIEYTFLTSLPEGDYDVKVVLDARNEVTEKNEGNNVHEAHFEVRSLPDLLFPNGADFSCSMADTIVHCAISSYVKNGGVSPISPFTLRISAFADGVLGYAKDTVISGLAVNADAPVAIEFSLPDTLSVTSEIRAVLHLNPDTSIAEKSLDNNKLEKSAPFSSTLNFAARESEESEVPVFTVSGIPVTEKITVLASALDSTMVLPIKIRVVRDTLDTLTRLDTNLTFVAGSLSKSLEFNWTPTDSAFVIDVLVAIDPDSTFTEMTRMDNFLRLRRAPTRQRIRFLPGAAKVDSSGNVSVKVAVRDYLRNSVSGLGKTQFSLAREGVEAEAGGLVALSNPVAQKQRIDVVIMDVHEPAPLYRARISYYELMPELKAEFARMGYSLEFKFRTPRFVLNALSQTNTPLYDGDLYEGIFNGQIRNVLDEPDRKYKWAPSATYLATYHPWRENSLRVIVPMYQFLGQGEGDHSWGDPALPTPTDSNLYHLEFADTCKNRNVHPFLLTSAWGFQELRDAQARDIIRIAGGELHFAAVKERMKAELRQFIASLLAEYEIVSRTDALPFALSDGDRIALRLMHQKDTLSDSIFVHMPHKAEIDARLQVTAFDVFRDTLFAKVQLGNASLSNMSGLRFVATQSKGGAVFSKSEWPLPPLSPSSIRNSDIALPLSADSVTLVLALVGDFNDKFPDNNADTLFVLCQGCRHPDLSMNLDTLV